MFQIDGHVHERHNSAFLLATVAMLIDSAFSAHAQNIMRQHIQACCSRSSQDADAAYVLYRALVFNGTSLNFNFFFSTTYPPADVDPQYTCIPGSRYYCMIQ